MQRTRTGVVLVAALLAVISGCGGNAQQREHMLNFGLAIQNYMDLYKNGPDGWDDLLEFVRKSPTGVDVKILEQVKADGYIVDWEADGFARMLSGADTYVFMYPPSTARRGGLALMCNFNVKELTADQLKEILDDMAQVRKKR